MAAGAGRAEARHLHAVTLNVFADDAVWPELRAHALVDLIARHLPHIIALQELNPASAKALFASSTLRRHYFGMQRLGQGPPPWTLVLSRWPVVDKRWVAGVGGWRGLHTVLLNATGLPLAVGSAHFTAADCRMDADVETRVSDSHSGGDVAATPGTKRGLAETVAHEAKTLPAASASSHSGARAAVPLGQCPLGLERALDLRAAIGAMEAFPAAEAILMGDFNFGSHPELFREESLELRRHSSWQDAWEQANGSDSEPGFSWNNVRNPMNKRDAGVPGFNFPSSRIDRIMVRGHLRALRASLVATQPVSCPHPSGPLHGTKPSAACATHHDGSVFLSDHFGVAVTLEMPLLEHAARA